MSQTALEMQITMVLQLGISWKPMDLREINVSSSGTVEVAEVERLLPLSPRPLVGLMKASSFLVVCLATHTGHSMGASIENGIDNARSLWAWDRLTDSEFSCGAFTTVFFKLSF